MANHRLARYNADGIFVSCLVIVQDNQTSPRPRVAADSNWQLICNGTMENKTKLLACSGLAWTEPIIALYNNIVRDR